MRIANHGGLEGRLQMDWGREDAERTFKRSGDLVSVKLGCVSMQLLFHDADLL